MRLGSRLVLGIITASLALTAVSPFITPQSNNPCAACHGNNYHQYLDILEGNPANILPQVLNDSELLTVAVVVKNICNAAKYNVMVGISVTLASQNGDFEVQTPTYNIASLDPGQTATASWQIDAVARGMDTMLITAAAHNNHYGCQFADSYNPPPTIFVNKTVIDLPPSITIRSPAAGLVLTGGMDRLVSWGANDEDRANCKVDLFYSIDDFVAHNETLATGIPATQTYTWTLPLIDCSTVSLKASITDPKGQYNETIMSGHFTIDSTPPQVVSVQPQDRGANVTDSAFLVARFSEPVTPSGSGYMFSIGPDPGGLVWSWNTNRTVMTAVHSQFEPGTAYTCTVSPAYKDLSIPGNQAAETFTWTFSTPTIVIPSPSMIMSSPGDGDRYYWGERMPLCWSASGGTGSLGINISISTNWSSGPFDLVANHLPNTGGFNLSVPRVVSDGCVLEATVYDQNGMEARALSGVFAVASNILLNASFPQLTDPMLAGTSINLSWNSTGGHGAVAVTLLFKAESNSSPQVAAFGLPPSGVQSWTAPELNSQAAHLILNATDGWNGFVEVSSPPFAVRTRNPPPPPPPPPLPAKPNNPPLVRFTVLDDRLMVKRLARFDASGSFDPDGDRLYYGWDFGDWTDPVNSTGPNATHIFQYSGEFRVRLVVGDGISETSQVETITVNAAPAAGTASSGEDGPIIWLGIVIMIVGSVGLAYSASGRMPSPAGRKPDAGSSPAPVQKTEPLPGGMTPEAIAAYTALYGTPPPSVAGGYAGALSSTAAPAEALPVPSEQMGTETCPEALLQPAAPSPQELQATLDAPAGVDDIFPLLLDPEKCIGCGTCSKACAPRAITMVDGRPALELAYCSLCGECVEGCARQAIMFNPAFKSGKSS